MRSEKDGIGLLAKLESIIIFKKDDVDNQRKTMWKHFTRFLLRQERCKVAFVVFFDLLYIFG